MVRMSVVVGAVLVLVGCTKEAAKEGASVEAGGEAEAAGVVVEKGDGGKREKVVIDDAAVGKFIVYRAEMAKILKETMDEIGKVEQTAEDKNALAAIGRASAAAERIDAKQEKVKKDSGLTDGQIEALDGLLADVVIPRMMMTEEMIQGTEATKAQFADMPADQRKEAEATITAQVAELREVRAATKARAKYGDEAVETVLRHEAELVGLQNGMSATLGGR